MKYLILQIVIMKFLLLNAQSFNTAKNDLYELVDKYDIYFLCLNETWENKDKPIKFRDWKISNGAKIRNRYNQVPHLTQDTNGKVTNSQKTPQTRAKRSALSQQVTTKHI